MAATAAVSTTTQVIYLETSAILTYDFRLAKAARAHGPKVVAPE